MIVYPSRLPMFLSNFLCISPTHLLLNLKCSFSFDSPQDYISATHGYGCGAVSWNVGNLPAATPSKNKFSSPRRYQLNKGWGLESPSQLYQNFSWFDFAPVTTVVMGSWVGYPCHVLKTVCTAPFPFSRSFNLSASSLGIFPKPGGWKTIISGRALGQLLSTWISYLSLHWLLPTAKSSSFDPFCCFETGSPRPPITHYVD